ncbi:MAG: transglutaminase family protein [Gammaproteobacteria bacterium]|jgi:transglutaminase-like putative cysteine protease
MQFNIRHRTTFEYEQLVSVAQHIMHLMPRDYEMQQRVAFAIHLDPEPSLQSLSQDYFGNWVHYMSLYEPHEHLIVESRARVDVLDQQPGLDAGAGRPWEDVASDLARSAAGALDASRFAFASPYIVTTPEIREYALASFTPNRPIFEATVDLTNRIFTEFEYQGGVSDVSTPVTEVLAMKKGVCQDFAHLEIACLRSLGLAARYVSGYILTHPPEGQEKLVGADASHAWLSMWAGDGLWIDFDPTNNVVPRGEHITIGWGRDYGDVSPINGCIVGGGAHEVTVGVDVTLVS